MLELYSPKYITGGEFQYKAYGYVPASGVQWELKTFAGNTGDINAEMHSDDILSADVSTQNIMYTKNGDRLCFGFIPFYIKNVDTVNVYDLGYKLYTSPSSTEANALGQTIASSSDSRKDASQSDSSRNLNSFILGDTGIFIRGVCDSTQLSYVQDLSSHIWTSGVSPGHIEIESNRVILSASSFIDAKDWHDASPFKSRNYEEDDFTINSYSIRKWSSGGRDSFMENGTLSSDVDKTIIIEPNGFAFGFIFFSITNSNDTVGQISRNGSGFSIIKHGNWTGDDLIDSNADEGVYMNTIRKPWEVSEYINTRLIRYGLHFVARKVNI
jgi:hypothetical protein